MGMTGYLHCEAILEDTLSPGLRVRTGSENQRSYSSANHRQETWGYESSIAWLGAWPAAGLQALCVPKGPGIVSDNKR